MLSVEDPLSKLEKRENNLILSCREGGGEMDRTKHYLISDMRHCNGHQNLSPTYILTSLSVSHNHHSTWRSTGSWDGGNGSLLWHYMKSDVNFEDYQGQSCPPICHCANNSGGSNHLMYFWALHGAINPGPIDHQDAGWSIQVCLDYGPI